MVKKILVPVRGRGADDDALKLACTVAQKSKAEVYVLYIIEVARDIGSAIVDEVVQRNVDLVVMGIGYRNPLGKFDLGDIIPYVLKEAPCQVLVYRGYKPSE